MPAVFRSLNLALLSFLVIAAAASADAQTTFATEIVVSEGYVGRNPSLAVAPDGTPYIAYNDNNLGYVVMLAHKSAGVWSMEQVSVHSAVYPMRSLALNSAGDPVVAFDYNQGARAGTRSGGVWSFEDYDAFSPWWVTLAIDSHDHRHVAYSWSWGTGIYQGYLYYDHENISITAFLQHYCSIALEMDPADRPHLLFTSVEGASMEYWSKPGFDWTFEPLPVGMWGALAIDNNHVPHIAYYDQAADDLIYGVRSPGGWVFEPVDSEGDVGQHPSLALDADGRPHVSYFDVTNGDLKYAVKKAGAWDRVVVDAAGIVGDTSSIAFVSGSTPAIAYFDASNQDLKYAVATAPVASRQATWGSVKAIYGTRR